MATPLLAACLAVVCCCSLNGQVSSPAEQKIRTANQAIDRNPDSAQEYSELAAALCERAAETGEVTYFERADQALSRSLRIAPGDYTAQKVKAAILLGLHRWTEALETAKTLNRRVPDDVAVWGLLAEAEIALGNYAEAEKATQWMFDLRPTNTAAFLPASKLREVSGDLDGASDFINEAFRRTPENESATRALLLTELGRLQLLNGNRSRAIELINGALKVYPDYHEALLVSATLHNGEAPELLGRRSRQVKTASASYDLAIALQQAGRKQEANAEFQHFEARAQAESGQPYNANRELVFYYVDRKGEPAKGLTVAEREISLRHDVAILDAYAWALFRNRKIAEAKLQSDKATATGTRDPQILSHSRQIAAAVR